MRETRDRSRLSNLERDESREGEESGVGDHVESGVWVVVKGGGWTTQSCGRGASAREGRDPDLTHVW